MATEIRWHGETFKSNIYRALDAKLQAIGVLGERDIKRMISKGGGIRGSGGKYRWRSRSQPGEPPHVDTGRLRRSITHEYDKERQSVRVGTNVTYAKWLELGTRKMAARPFLRPWLDKSRPDIERILGGGSSGVVLDR